MNIKMIKERKNKGKYIELFLLMILILLGFPNTVSAGATGAIGGGLEISNGVVSTIKNYDNQVTVMERKSVPDQHEKNICSITSKSCFQLFFYCSDLLVCSNRLHIEMVL